MEDEHRLSARKMAALIRRELACGDLDFVFRIMTSAIADFRDTAPENREDFLMPPESTGSIQRSPYLRLSLGLKAAA
jgi:hypothetical protein